MYSAWYFPSGTEILSFTSVFARSIPELNAKSNPDEHINYFSKYDFWREKEFEFSISYRYESIENLG